VRRRIPGLALGFAIALAVPCFGGNDAEFHAVVRTIETQYGVHHMRIPFLGFATVCLKVARIPGASGLKLAVFDNLPKESGISDEALQESIEASIGGTWRPMVRVRSNDDHNLTMVYANPSDKEMRVLVVYIDPNTATVVQTKLKASQIRKWIQQPDEVTHVADNGGD
jgi:hypothetical protein